MKTTRLGRIKLHALCSVLLGLATGYFLARTFRPPEPGAAETDRPAGPLVSSHRERQTGPAAGMRLRSHTLEALLHLDWRRVWREETDRQLAAMDTRELQRLLAESDADRLAKYKEGYAAENLRRRIIREIYQREREGALDWAARQPFHPEVLGEFVANLARDDLAAALAWKEPLLRLAEEYDAKHPAKDGGTKGSVQAYWVGVIECNATSQGVEAVLKARETLGSFTFGGQFPTDFDYARMVDRLGADTLSRCFGLGTFFQSWADKDKDSALSCARQIEERHSDKRYVNLMEAVFRSVRAAEGEKNAAGWLADQLANESPERRCDQLLSMGQECQVAPSPSGFSQIMNELESDQDRSAYLAGFIGSSHHEPWLPMAYLEEFGAIETQAAALERAAMLEIRSNPPARGIASLRERYALLTNKPGFPPAARERILTALQEEGTQE